MTTESVRDAWRSLESSRRELGLLVDPARAMGIDLALRLSDRRARVDHWRRVYKLSVLDVFDLYTVQHGQCPICLETLGDFVAVGFVVDHDHVTKTVRGLLHEGCNTYLGRLGDTLESVEAAMTRLGRALEYLRAAA